MQKTLKSAENRHFWCFFACKKKEMPLWAVIYIYVGEEC